MKIKEGKIKLVLASWALTWRFPGSFRSVAESHAVKGLKSLWPCWLLPGGRSQFPKAVCLLAFLDLWPTLSSELAVAQWILLAILISLPSFLLFSPAFEGSTSTDYSGPTQIIQDNCPILESVISNLTYICKIPLLCDIKYLWVWC